MLELISEKKIGTFHQCVKTYSVSSHLQPNISHKYCKALVLAWKGLYQLVYGRKAILNSNGSVHLSITLFLLT